MGNFFILAEYVLDAQLPKELLNEVARHHDGTRLFGSKRLVNITTMRLCNNVVAMVMNK